MLDVGQAGKGMALNAVQRIVVQQKETHVGSACEGELFNLVNFVMIEQEDAYIL